MYDMELVKLPGGHAGIDIFDYDLESYEAEPLFEKFRIEAEGADRLIRRDDLHLLHADLQLRPLVHLQLRQRAHGQRPLCSAHWTRRLSFAPYVLRV